MKRLFVFVLAKLSVHVSQRPAYAVNVESRVLASIDLRSRPTERINQMLETNLRWDCHSHTHSPFSLRSKRRQKTTRPFGCNRYKRNP